MIIAGVTCFAAQWPKPTTIPALKWNQLESGLWRATDRGVSNDQYLSDIVIYDTQAVIESLWNALKTGSGRYANTVNLGTDDEKIIFGAEVTCTVATVEKYGVPTETAFAGANVAMYSLALTLRALTYTLAGVGDNTWPDILRVQDGWKAGSDSSINKIRSFTSVMTYDDHLADTGTFEGTFLMFTPEIKKTRHYLMTLVRGNAVSMPDIGVIWPFGNSDGFPTIFDSNVTFRVIAWEDMGRQDYVLSKIKLTLGFENWIQS